MDWFLYDKHLRYERVKNRLKKVLVIAKHKHFVNIKASYHRKQYRVLRKNIFRNRRKSFINFKWWVSKITKITKFNKLCKQDIPTITYLFILFRNNNNSVFTANFCCSSCFGVLWGTLYRINSPWKILMLVRRQILSSGIKCDRMRTW